MKMFSLKSAVISVLSVAMALVFATQAFAMAPNLTLTSSGNGIISVTVLADPNANVILDYYSGGQLLGAGMIGTTNYSGYFSGTINASSYVIPAGAQVIVMVNGQQSLPATWPSNIGYNPYPYNNGGYPIYTNGYTTGGPISLSQNSVNLAIGQTQSITINNSAYNGIYGTTTGQYFISSAPTPSVATAAINGNSLTLYGQNTGSTSVTVCSGVFNYGLSDNNNCATVYVTVTGNYNNYNYGYPYTYTNPTYPSTTYPYNVYPYNNYTYSTPLSVTNSNVQVTVGNAGVVTIYGNNASSVYPYTGYADYNSNYYVTNNNAGIANATISGNTLTVYGTAPGTTSVTVCSTNGNQCATVNVTVIAPINTYNGAYNYNSPYNYPTQSGNWYYSYPDHCWHRQN